MGQCNTLLPKSKILCDLIGFYSTFSGWISQNRRLTASSPIAGSLGPFVMDNAAEVLTGMGMGPESLHQYLMEPSGICLFKMRRVG